MERMLQKPFTDPNRSVIIQQALVRAYESGCRDEIYAAAKEAQKYVDEGGDWMQVFDDSLEDYQGSSPEKLADMYLLRLLRDRHCDDDENQEYITTGWCKWADKNYLQYLEFKTKYQNKVLLFGNDVVAYNAYEQDADILNKVCGAPLLDWDGVKVAGFPYHALDIYLTKLVRAGYSIAVCDRLEDPKKVQKQVQMTKMLDRKRKEPVQLSLFD
jgi:hypothetical protein